MRKIGILFFVLGFTLLITSPVLSQQNAEDEKFQKFLDNYFDQLWKFFPTAATLAGYHTYDNKLEDMSKKNIEKHHETLDFLNQELVTKIDRTQLSPDFQIDHVIIANGLDSELIKHENLLPWEYDPIFYNKIFINCTRSLTIKEFASLDARAKNAADRLKALVKLIKQAKENLKTPPQLFTETAIKQFPAVLNFYKNELPGWIEQAPAASKSKLQSNLANVIPALEDYRNFLKNELLPRSTGNFRLAEAHRRIVRITFQNDIPLDELIARAQADSKNIRREMFLVGIPFYRIMDPKINLDNPPANLTEDQLINTVVTHVLDKIKGDHASKDDFIDAVKTLTEKIKTFLIEKQLVDLPEENINIEPMPFESQNASWTQLVTPGIYETAGTYSCLIFPFTDDLSGEQTESLLEEHNNFLLPFWTIRNVYPGSFVPTLITNRNSSLVRKLYPNLALIKGWPVLLEEKLIMAKYGNYDLRLRLNQLKYKLRAAIDFILDFNIHEGSWTKEQATAYMTRVGFLSKAEAELQWNHVILNPADIAYVYVGMQEFLDMEKDYKQFKGDSFDQKEFLSKVLNHGALPLRFMKTKIKE